MAKQHVSLLTTSMYTATLPTRVTTDLQLIKRPINPSNRRTTIIEPWGHYPTFWHIRFSHTCSDSNGQSHTERWRQPSEAIHLPDRYHFRCWSRCPSLAHKWCRAMQCLLHCRFFSNHRSGREDAGKHYSLHSDWCKRCREQQRHLVRSPCCSKPGR
jgi:hypothetical protein